MFGTIVTTPIVHLRCHGMHWLYCSTLQLSSYSQEEAVQHTRVSAPQIFASKTFLYLIYICVEKWTLHHRLPTKMVNIVSNEIF